MHGPLQAPLCDLKKRKFKIYHYPDVHTCGTKHIYLIILSNHVKYTSLYTIN